MSCRTRCQRSVNHADLCDLKKRMKYYWWLWRALFVHILHALLIVLLKLHFAVEYRSLSMFGVWMWPTAVTLLPSHFFQHCICKVFCGTNQNFDLCCYICLWLWVLSSVEVQWMTMLSCAFTHAEISSLFVTHETRLTMPSMVISLYYEKAGMLLCG